jgi:hypothetical protein
MGRSDQSSTPILQYPITPILNTPPLHRAFGKHTGRKLQAGRRADLWRRKERSACSAGTVQPARSSEERRKIEHPANLNNTGGLELR